MNCFEVINLVATTSSVDQNGRMKLRVEKCFMYTKWLTDMDGLFVSIIRSLHSVKIALVPFAVCSVSYTTSTHESFETSNRELSRLISYRKFHFVAAPVTHDRLRKTMKRTIVAALIQIMLGVSSFKMYYVSRKRKYA